MAAVRVLADEWDAHPKHRNIGPQFAARIYAVLDLDPIGRGPEHPEANGHRWPCAGFYTGNHNEALLDAWSCTCGAGRG